MSARRATTSPLFSHFTNLIDSGASKMDSTEQSRTRNAVDPTQLCQFSFSDGRQCRMLRHQSHPSFCLIHAREEQQLLPEEEIGQELMSISGQFRTTTDTNHFLGKLLNLQATPLIPPRRT